MNIRGFDVIFTAKYSIRNKPEKQNLENEPIKRFRIDLDVMHMKHSVWW